MFYVYILKSVKLNQLYIGSTNNLKRRFIEHNKGLVPSTKAKRPLDLIYYEAYKVESEARHRELSLKLRGRARLQLLKRIQKSIEN